MSIRAMNWAWEQVLGVSHKIVLVALADHADNDGVCWPGMAWVSEKTGVKKRTLIKVIHELEREGLITVERRKGEQGKQDTNRYLLDLKDQRKARLPGAKIDEPGATGAPGEPGAKNDEPGAKIDMSRVQTVAPGTTKNVRTQIEPSIEPSARAREIRIHENRIVGIPDDLKLLWRQAYPGIDIDHEIRKAELWLFGPPRRHKPDLAKFLRNWLSKASPGPPAATSIAPSGRVSTACKVCGKPGVYGTGRDWFCGDHPPGVLQ